jgi:hypothetical protein
MMNTIRFARRSIARALCLVAFAAAAPAAAIPDVVTWAARVENDAGPFDGSMTVTFELFDAVTGGAALWTELVPSAVVVNGDLVHELGSVEPLDDSIIDRDNLFLQVTMNGDVLAPRTALRAVPYALRSSESAHAEEAAHAADATTLAGLAAASFQFTAGAGGGLKLTGTAFAVNSSGIVTTMIADGAVTTAKIGSDAVTTEKVSAGAITAPKIANDAVSSEKISTNAVTTTKVANDAITADKIAANAVTSTEIAAGAVTSAKIANDAVGIAQMAGLTRLVRTMPDGCGGGLRMGTSCKTIACGFNITLRFFNCAATSCNETQPATCGFADGVTPVGSTVFGE